MAATRLIVVGTGGAGEWWVRGVTEAADVCTPVALVDVEPAHLQRAVQANKLDHVPAFVDYTEALASVEADGVVLVTPNNLHAAMATAALERGLHVLSEKPLASTMDEALTLLRLSTERNRRYAVSQNYRWTPQVAALRRALRAGVAGDLAYITYRFARSVALRGWRTRLPEILLEDMAIHHFDLLRHLLEREAVTVIARSFRPPWATVEGRPCAHALLQFEGGIEVAYSGSWAPREAATSWHGESVYVGALGAVAFDGQRSPRVTLADGTQRDLPAESMPHPGPAYVLRSFCQAVQTGTEPVCAIADNIKSLALVHAAIESARRGGEPVSPAGV